MTALDLQIFRKGRKADKFQADGDPNPAWLMSVLRNWLESHKWDPALWGQFELVAREARRWKVVGKVRA